MVFYERKKGWYVTLKNGSKIGVRTKAEAHKYAKRYKGKVGYGQRRLLRVRKSPKKRSVRRTGMRLGFMGW
jgi:hypothetical protein